ncbi:hypothetical protein MHYP_G00195570 [Metynnis hypsauchen]
MAQANEQHNKTSIQCQDDPFGFNAQVVYEATSFPLRRCTPFLTTYRGPEEANLSRESQESILNGTPMISGETMDDQDITTDGAQQATKDQLISLSVQLDDLQDTGNDPVL